MKERAWRKWEVAGLFFTLIWGNVFHFVFDWSGENVAVGAIAAVNESVWEHMKLLTVPWVLFSLVTFFAQGRSGDSLLPRAVGLAVGAAFIPVAYYSYVGITGSNISLVNILIYQLAVLLAFFLSWHLQGRGIGRGRGRAFLGGAILLLMLVLAVVWTYYPPQLPLFTDPQTGHTGLPKNESRS